MYTRGEIIMIKYIIFDFDGTLVDSKDIAIASINMLAEKYRFKKICEEDIEALRNLTIAERCKALNVPLYKLPLWAAEFYSLYKNAMKELDLFDGIKETLTELRNRGYEIAIISSNSEHIIREFLSKHKIDIINKIYCSKNLFGKDKIIKRFLSKHKLKSSEVIYVGDEHRDIIACKKNEVKVIWVDWGFDVIETIKPDIPDYIAYKPADILTII